jgi:hypothetical protein
MRAGTTALAAFRGIAVRPANALGIRGGAAAADGRTDGGIGPWLPAMDRPRGTSLVYSVRMKTPQGSCGYSDFGQGVSSGGPEPALRKAKGCAMTEGAVLPSGKSRHRSGGVRQGNPRSRADRSSRVATPASAPQAVPPPIRGLRPLRGERRRGRGPNGVQMSGDESGTVAADHHRRAGALFHRITEVTARAGIHDRHQQSSRERSAWRWRG